MSRALSQLGGHPDQRASSSEYSCICIGQRAFPMVLGHLDASLGSCRRFRLFDPWKHLLKQWRPLLSPLAAPRDPLVSLLLLQGRSSIIASGRDPSEQKLETFSVQCCSLPWACQHVPLSSFCAVAHAMRVSKVVRRRSLHCWCGLQTHR